MITKAELAKMLDHSMLKPDFTKEQIVEGTEYAREMNTSSVCVTPDRIELVQPILEGSDVKVCTVIGFPHGTHTTETKTAEAKDAYEKGARELDMVVNIGAIKDGDFDKVAKDIKGVVDATPAPVKVILENVYLTDDEIIRVCQISEEAGAAFVKTSTGFAVSGAEVSDVKLMRETVSDAVKVKASGGIRTLDDCLAMIDAGAERIGVSATEAILGELEA